MLIKVASLQSSYSGGSKHFEFCSPYIIALFYLLEDHFHLSFEVDFVIEIENAVVRQATLSEWSIG